MDTAEYNALRKTMDEEKARVRKGYERIREILKSSRQDYRAAVNRGTRSGSGKLVQDNFDLLTEIRGGSPATTSLPFGIDGDTIGEETDTEDPKAEELLERSSSSYEGYASSCESRSSTPSFERQVPKTSAVISKLVDNKRKHMEKGLSQAQRDQVLMNTAKEDVLMKKQLLEAIERSNDSLDKSLTKMTNCLNSLGEGISSGMQMIAMALAGTMPHPNQTHAHYVSSPAYLPNYNFYHTASQNASTTSFNFSEKGPQHYMSTGTNSNDTFEL